MPLHEIRHGHSDIHRWRLTSLPALVDGGATLVSSFSCGLSGLGVLTVVPHSVLRGGGVGHGSVGSSQILGGSSGDIYSRRHRHALGLLDLLVFSFLLLLCSSVLVRLPCFALGQVRAPHPCFALDTGVLGSFVWVARMYGSYGLGWWLALGRWWDRVQPRSRGEFWPPLGQPAAACLRPSKTPRGQGGRMLSTTHQRPGYTPRPPFSGRRVSARFSYPSL
ncbi:hypothetical protein VTO73DRAFT_2625 [Trametes versicolor]